MHVVFYYNCGDGKGDFYSVCVCVFVIGEEGREVKCRQD